MAWHGDGCMWLLQARARGHSGHDGLDDDEGRGGNDRVEEIVYIVRLQLQLVHGLRLKWNADSWLRAIVAAARFLPRGCYVSHSGIIALGFITSSPRCRLRCCVTCVLCWAVLCCAVMVMVMLYVLYKVDLS